MQQSRVADCCYKIGLYLFRRLPSGRQAVSTVLSLSKGENGDMKIMPSLV